MVNAEETIVDNIVGIPYKFGIASKLEINWHKSVAYWYGQGRLRRWVGNIPMKVGRNWRFDKTIRHPIWTTTRTVGRRPISDKHGQGQTQILELYELVTCRANPHRKPCLDVIP